MRLQKWIAGSGAMSRRKAEEAISAGRIRVNGVVVTTLGTTIVPGVDEVTLDGRTVVQPEVRRIFAFHKPRLVMTTKSDPQGRPTLMEYFPPELQSLNPVGRLDFESEGLILLTDDGELANRLAHPRYGVRKEYRVGVRGIPSADAVRALLSGVELEDGPGRFEQVRPVGRDVFDVVVSEGRNRFVRRMWDAVGHPVERLLRTRVGGLMLGELRPGKFRELGAPEVERLLNSQE